MTKRGDDETTQLYLIHNGGGEGVRLTEHPTSVADIAWSPDGGWIYFVAADDPTPEEKAREEVKDDVFAFDENWKHRHLWRVPLEGGQAERVTQGEFTVRGYQISRDGSRIVQHRAPTPASTTAHTLRCG